MNAKFTLAGLHTDVLTSDDNNHHRALVKKQLQAGTINYLFVVDLFNEGVDIPEIDTILFLRPTESATVFLQQFGRDSVCTRERTILPYSTLLAIRVPSSVIRIALRPS